MAESTLKEKLEKFGIKTAINYLRKDPEKNLPKLMDMIDKADKMVPLLPRVTPFIRLLTTRTVRGII